jgi:hypothetical protein
MTSARDSGYELIYLTPNRMADWTDGEAVIRLDVSSLAQSERDWWDVVVQPIEDNWALPVNVFAAPDLQGPAPDSVVFTLHDGDGAMAAQVHRSGTPTLERFDTSVWWVGADGFLKLSATVRSTWEFRISRTHISACLVSANGPTDPGDEPLPFCFVDLDIEPLSWTRGTVSIGHHSYDPGKACKPSATEPNCANTWHWDNLSITPSAPFTMIRANQRYVWNGEWDAPTNDSERTLTFPEPAPPNSYLRFSAIGAVKLNGVLVKPLGGADYDEGHFSSYFVPIPEGTTSVRYEGGPDGWWRDTATLKDASIWSW